MLKVNIHWFTVFLFVYHNNSTRKTPISWSLKESITVKVLNIWIPYKFAVVILRFEQLKRYEPFHDKPTKWLCAQGKLRSAWACAQSDQSLRFVLTGWLRTQAFFMRTAKTLIRLGRCPGWSESSLGAHAILLGLLWGGSYVDGIANSEDPDSGAVYSGSSLHFLPRPVCPKI